MSTIPQFLPVISHFHAKSYLPSPSTSLSVTRALEGAKRSFGRPSIQRKIISPEMLRSLADLISTKISFPRLRTIWRKKLCSSLGYFILTKSLLWPSKTLFGQIMVLTLSYVILKQINTLKALGFQLLFHFKGPKDLSCQTNPILFSSPRLHLQLSYACYDWS